MLHQPLAASVSEGHTPPATVHNLFANRPAHDWVSGTRSGPPDGGADGRTDGRTGCCRDRSDTPHFVIAAVQLPAAPSVLGYNEEINKPGYTEHSGN
jgi:hypothetical protein